MWTSWFIFDGQILYRNAPHTDASCLHQGCVRWSKILLPDHEEYQACKLNIIQMPESLFELSSFHLTSAHHPTATLTNQHTPSYSNPDNPPPHKISLSSETWLRNWHRKSLNGYQTFRGATCTLWGLNMCLEETTSAITTWPLQRPSLLYPTLWSEIQSS